MQCGTGTVHPVAGRTLRSDGRARRQQRQAFGDRPGRWKAHRGHFPLIGKAVADTTIILVLIVEFCDTGLQVGNDAIGFYRLLAEQDRISLTC